jgi:hypothetical protein
LQCHCFFFAFSITSWQIYVLLFLFLSHFLLDALILILYIALVIFYPQLNESAPEEKEAPGCPPRPLLKILEDILHNRIKQKKTEMHKTQNRADITLLLLDIPIIFNQPIC